MKILLITTNITKSYIHSIAWIVQWLVPQFVFSKLLSNCTGNLSSILSPSSRYLDRVAQLVARQIGTFQLMVFPEGYRFEFYHGH